MHTRRLKLWGGTKKDRGVVSFEKTIEASRPMIPVGKPKTETERQNELTKAYEALSKS